MANKRIYHAVQFNWVRADGISSGDRFTKSPHTVLAKYATTKTTEKY